MSNLRLFFETTTRDSALTVIPTTNPQDSTPGVLVSIPSGALVIRDDRDQVIYQADTDDPAAARDQLIRMWHNHFPLDAERMADVILAAGWRPPNNL